MLTEAELRQQGWTVATYPKAFAEAEKIIAHYAKQDEDKFDRDENEKTVEAKKKKYDDLTKAAQLLTGEHRLVEGVPDAWARDLIKQSCNREGNDKIDMLGILKQGAVTLVPNLVGTAAGVFLGPQAGKMVT